jgi:hypothetical protein
MRLHDELVPKTGWQHDAVLSGQALSVEVA